VVGEIYIAGAGVARGYLNQAELTAARFVPDVFDTDPNARMYRTGDLGRWREDGTIVYLGRNDHQVKIRGVRIELGEIEARLVAHPDVKEAAVIAREDAPGEKRLVAYVVLKNGAGSPTLPQAPDLRAHVRATLPEQMIPSVFMTLEALPLTANGKLDRRALPAPQANAEGSREYEAPQGEVESALAEIWQAVLRVSRVGRADNFFEMGGHSLLAMQAVVRVRAALCVDMSVSAIFQCPTLQQLAGRIEELRAASLAERICSSDVDVASLLERVAAMPDEQARELVRELRPR
jgi:acyl carrier protein